MTLFRNFRDRDTRGGGSVIDDLVITVGVCSGDASVPPLRTSLHFRECMDCSDRSYTVHT